MITLERLLNVTIYLGYFYFSFRSLLLLLKEGLIYYFSIWNFFIFGAQIITGIKFFHNYGFSFHSKLELLIFIFYVIGIITCILLFFHFQNLYRILLICSFIFNWINYYFKETLNFSKKFQSNIKLFKYTRRLFSKRSP